MGRENNEKVREIKGKRRGKGKGGILCSCDFSFGKPWVIVLYKLHGVRNRLVRKRPTEGVFVRL